jgi:hypothetical protein
MFYWSLKTLLAEPMRLMVSALAVAVSFVLVIFFSAVFEGESDQMVVYLEQTHAYGQLDALGLESRLYRKKSAGE